MNQQASYLAVKCESCQKVANIIMQPMGWCSQCWRAELKRSNATNAALGRPAVKLFQPRKGAR